MGRCQAACVLSCILGTSHALLGVVHAAYSSSRGEQQAQRAQRSLFNPEHGVASTDSSRILKLDSDSGAARVDGRASDPTVAICVSVKGENAGDLAEWAQYYRWLGVDHIFITENDLRVPEEMQTSLQHFVDDGFVHLEAWGTDAPSQSMIYGNCFDRIGETYEWVAFIDADEYIMVLEEGKDLKSLLAEYQDHPALALNWIFFGANARRSRPPQPGMLRWYTQCNPTPHDHIKVIANSKFVANVNMSHPHNMYYKNDARAVGEDFLPIAHDLGAIGAGTESCPETPDQGNNENPFMVDCHPDPGHLRVVPEIKRIALFHYVTRSWEDFLLKMERGDGNGGKKIGKTEEFFKAVQRDTSMTGGICDRGLLAWPECCSKTGLQGRPHAHANNSARR